MFGSSDLGINHCSFFEYIEIVLVLLGQFQILKMHLSNLLQIALPNMWLLLQPNKHLLVFKTCFEDVFNTSSV